MILFFSGLLVGVMLVIGFIQAMYFGAKYKANKGDKLINEGNTLVAQKDRIMGELKDIQDKLNGSIG